MADPGGSVTAIIRDGEIASTCMQRGRERRHGGALTPILVFYVGSIAKQFVAACALFACR